MTNKLEMPLEQFAEAVSKQNRYLSELNQELITALRACHASLNVAFDYDGDVFGIHHNAAVDADIMAKRVLEKVDWRITDDDR